DVEGDGLYQSRSQRHRRVTRDRHCGDRLYTGTRCCDCHLFARAGCDVAAGGDDGDPRGGGVGSRGGDVGRLGGARTPFVAAGRSRGSVLMAIAANGVAIVGGRLVHRLAATVGSSALVWYGVPLAWRNLLDDRRRLLRSTMGIAFAVLLMLVELGFRDAFLESALQIIRGFDADIVLVSATKFRFGRKDPFSRRHLYVARGSPGVASAAPVYGEWTKSLWKNPQTHKPYTVQVLAFDPDQPVFLFPDITARLSELRQPDTVVVDRRGRRFLGTAQEGTQTELAARAIRVVGTFPLGPDFTDDGTLVMSDRNFFTLFSPRTLGNHELPNIEIGIVKVLPGYPVRQVQATLQQTLGKTVSVLTKNEMIDREISFQSTVSPVGPIFAFGTAIGFAVGILI